MNNIVVIIVFFGKVRPTFRLWLESAKRNNKVDFLLFMDEPPDLPLTKNIKIIPFSLCSFNQLAIEKLKIDFIIDRTYKLCDFKPMFGYIFDDYIREYEYWAYGDVDLIYGNILSILNRISYKKYKKINFAGHLCFMKNTNEINCLFKVSTPDSKNYYDILEGENVGFDESDINLKAFHCGVDIFDGIFSADLNTYEKQMKLVCGADLKKFFNINQKHPPFKKNYRHQFFVVEKGKVMRYYKKGLIIKRDEFCYLHFRRECPIYLKNLDSDTFLLSFIPKGFFEINISKIHTLFGFCKILLLLYLIKKASRYLLI